jgi:uncharacterized protein YciI
VEFDSFTVCLLVMRPDAPELDEQAGNELQDAHLAHLAALHEAGQLLAAGPLGDERFRGLNLFRADADRARELAEQDPAVKAGRFSIKTMPWHVPAGAMSFSQTRFPHSMADVEGG